MHNREKHIDPAAVEAELAAAREIARFFAERGLTGDAAPGYFIHTLGCQQNEADSERLRDFALSWDTAEWKKRRMQD